jgi:RES domain-containing protein
VLLDEEEAPGTLVAIPVDIPENVSMTRVKTSSLPSNWRATPPPEGLAGIGTRWIQAKNTPVLAVPSAIIPHELNYLLNPLHSHFKRVRVGAPERLGFDPRPWKSSP